MKILMIGNSFADNTIKYTYDIAKSQGIKDFDIWNLYIGGCPINTHYHNIVNDLPAYELREYDKSKECWTSTYGHSINELLDRQEYDYIFFQQASHESGVPESYDNLNALMDEVSKKSKKAKFCWLMTWAYAGYTKHPNFPRYNCDSYFMYERICECVKEKILTNDRIYKMVPTGTAVELLFEGGMNVHKEDGFHLNEKEGELTAGLCLMRAFFDIDFETVFHQKDVSEENFKKITNAVRKSYIYTLMK